jgi:hypothetical protein
MIGADAMSLYDTVSRLVLDTKQCRQRDAFSIGDIHPAIKQRLRRSGALRHLPISELRRIVGEMVARKSLLEVDDGLYVLRSTSHTLLRSSWRSPIDWPEERVR